MDRSHIGITCVQLPPTVTRYNCLSTGWHIISQKLNGVLTSSHKIWLAVDAAYPTSFLFTPPMSNASYTGHAAVAMGTTVTGLEYEYCENPSSGPWVTEDTTIWPVSTYKYKRIKALPNTTAGFVEFNASYAQLGGLAGMQLNREAASGKCHHEMVEYIGFTHSYKYCKKCDAKEK